MRPLALVILVLFVSLAPARAEWTANGVPICTTADRQMNPVITTDGAGGAIIAWATTPTNFGPVYAQRVGADGTPMWTTDGVLICGVDALFNSIRIVPDGAGGAIIAWTDLRSADPNVFAQRVDASGTPLWAPNGVPAFGSLPDQYLVALHEDDAGGAFFAWSNDAAQDVVAHRMDGAGSPALFKTDGLTLSSVCDNGLEASIVEDGVGGAIVAWSTGGTLSDVYIQRLNGDGLQYWRGGGEIVCNSVLGQTKPMVLSDGAEGAYVVWQDSRPQVHIDVYAQRFMATGERAWGAYPNGRPICNADGNQMSPQLVADGSGGFITLWSDSRGGTTDLYAQRVDADGSIQWVNNGVLFVSALGPAPWTHSSDGAGGVIVTYSVPNVYDIVAHRFSATGSALWPGGVTLCNLASNQHFPVLTSDGAGGAIVTWLDYRANPSTADIYAQHVASGGQIPTAVEAPAFVGSLALSAGRPNPFNGQTEFTLTLGTRSDITMEVFDVAGRRVRQSVMRDVSAGLRRLSFDGKSDDGRTLASGVYFYRVKAAGETITRKMVIAR